MIAESVSVGTELLMGQIADTNAQHLGKVLPELGIRHHLRQTVGDNFERLTAALKLALSRSDIVFTIGGLGPTQDDLTRDGIAAALGETLVPDPKIEEHLRKLFAIRNLTWTESQRRQTMRPASSIPIDNPNGTAPGLLCEKGGKVVIALPGPKGEFVPMVNGPVRDFLSKLSHDGVIHSRILRVCGLGESIVEERIKGLLDSDNPTVAPYAKPGEVHLRVTARGATTADAESVIQPFEAKIREVLGDAVFGVDEVTLEAAVLELLKDRKATLAIAESVTGGGISQRITSVPGASETYIGGVVTYAMQTKTSELGVDSALLQDPNIGPVSAEVARAMAEGVRAKFGADYGLAVTGNAGPTSDFGDRPVGLVYISVATPTSVETEEFKFRGIREDIRFRAGQFALTLLRKALLSSS
jgi:nicotinamide-nucleotide amidase